MATSGSHIYNPNVYSEGETFDTELYNDHLEKNYGDENAAYTDTMNIY